MFGSWYRLQCKYVFFEDSNHNIFLLFLSKGPGKIRDPNRTLMVFAAEKMNTWSFLAVVYTSLRHKHVRTTDIVFLHILTPEKRMITISNCCCCEHASSHLKSFSNSMAHGKKRSDGVRKQRNEGAVVSSLDVVERPGEHRERRLGTDAALPRPRRLPGAWFRSELKNWIDAPPNSERLILGCIETEFCK